MELHHLDGLGQYSIRRPNRASNHTAQSNPCHRATTGGVHRPEGNPVGCNYSVHAREQGIWTRPRSRARPRPWKLRGFSDRKHSEAGPSKLSGRCSGLDPRVLNRSRPSRATRHPRRGLPPPQELAARLERHQVSGRISISAPFTLAKRQPRRAGSDAPAGKPVGLSPAAYRSSISGLPHSHLAPGDLLTSL